MQEQMRFLSVIKPQERSALFAKLPDAATKVEAVPTGIVFDGTRFLVTTLEWISFCGRQCQTLPNHHRRHC
jgi:hypothetical protein